jgi:hypothetical protein
MIDETSVESITKLGRTEIRYRKDGKVVRETYNDFSVAMNRQRTLERGE